MDRQAALRHWLATTIGECRVGEHFGDASFRSYWRIHTPERTFVAMDAPPGQEDCRPYVVVDAAFEALGLKVPHIYEKALDQGFLLLDDFGDDQLYRVLNDDNVDVLYRRAIAEIPKIQSCHEFNGEPLPQFDAKWLREELDNFETWFLVHYLKLELSEAEKKLYKKTCTFLIEHVLSQPQVCIHRDFHSKNLMRLPENQIGLLDFQDAMQGSVVYDLVSLIRDCYIDWPLEKVYGWVKVFYDLIKPDVDFERFCEWFDLAGMQRHLKATFIFARKALRDNDPSYLMYIPRTLGYIQYVAEKYSVFHDFAAFMKKRVVL